MAALRKNHPLRCVKSHGSKRSPRSRPNQSENGIRPVFHLDWFLAPYKLYLSSDALALHIVYSACCFCKARYPV